MTEGEGSHSCSYGCPQIKSSFIKNHLLSEGGSPLIFWHNSNDFIFITNFLNMIFLFAFNKKLSGWWALFPTNPLKCRVGLLFPGAG